MAHGANDFEDDARKERILSPTNHQRPRGSVETCTKPPEMGSVSDPLAIAAAPRRVHRDLVLGVELGRLR